MKRFLYIFTLVILPMMSMAQTVSRKYTDMPLPQVLTDLSRAAKGAYNLYFIHNELEDFRITCNIKQQTLPDALRTVIGFYPISMTLEGRNIFIEPMQKEKPRVVGRIVDEHLEPLAYANISLFTTDGKQLLGKGVSNQGGHFAIPCDSTKTIVRVSYVGYQTHQAICGFQAGTISLRPSNTFLHSVTVNQSQPSLANVSTDQPYAQFAQQVCNWVWNMPQKEFTLTEVPSVLQKHDIVALAEYDSICFDHGQNIDLAPLAAATFGIPGIVANAKARRLDFHCISHLHRVRLALNSDSATSQLSTICYPRFFDTNSIRRDVIGIKVEKPDGQVRFVDTFYYLQPVDRPGELKRPERITIDSLSKGDILDIFYFTLTTASLIPQYTYTFSFSKHIPTLNLKYRIACDAPTYLRYKYFHWSKPFDIGISEDRFYREMQFDALVLMPEEGKKAAAMSICVQGNRHTMTGLFEKKGEGGIEEDRSLVRTWNECFLNN